MKSCLLLLLIGVSSIGQAIAQYVNADFILQRMKNESYDIRERPIVLDQEGHPIPTAVEMNMLFRRLSNLDFASMSYDLQVTLRQSWKDPRLAFEHLGKGAPPFVILQDRDVIWRPDTFFPDEIRAHRHDIDKPNIMYRIFTDGSVFMSERLSLTISCPMYLANFPFDTQECHLNLASYAHRVNTLSYTWAKNHPIQIKVGFTDALPNFVLDNYRAAADNSVSNTGTYSSLTASFTLKRCFGYYIRQVYMPSAMLVILSWVPFWLKPSAAPTRMLIGVVILFALVVQAGVVNSTLPPVPYVKAIDVWIGSCLEFIFASVVVHALVGHLFKKSEHRAKISVVSSAEHSTGTVETANGLPEEDHLLSNNQSKKGCFARLASFLGLDGGDKIDAKSRIIFPLIFAIFCVVYWIAYGRTRSAC